MVLTALLRPAVARHVCFSSVLRHDLCRTRRRHLSELRENIYTVPNAITVARLVSTPFIGHLIVAQKYDLALGLVFVAGASDFVDGWIARRYPSQRSLIGAVIDPIADKVLIGCTVGAMTYTGLLPLPLAGIVLLRDAGLMGASFYVRYLSLKPHLSGAMTWRDYWDFSRPSATVTPTTISKVNTVLQLLTIYASLAAPIFSFADHPALHGLWWLTAGTTVASGASYVFSKDAVVHIRPPARPPASSPHSK